MTTDFALPSSQALAERVRALVARLDLGPDGLRAPVHIPGAFADLVAGFDIDAFEAEATASHRLTMARTDGYVGDTMVMYQGDTSYHAWFDEDRDRVAARHNDPRAWAATATLPLPKWALAVQEALVLQLFDRSAFGWSTEMFYSFQPSASMGLHADNDDVFTVQLFGAKHWLVGPVDLGDLHRHEIAGHLHRAGPEDTWHFDPGKAPTLPAPWHVTVRAGDFLATPAFALHHVTAAADPARSVAFNVSLCREEVWRRFVDDRTGGV
jgi:hypothetical protein